jgi:hypothetical protein
MLATLYFAIGFLATIAILTLFFRGNYFHTITGATMRHTSALPNEPEHELLYTARACRDIAARFGYSSFGRDQLPPIVASLLLAHNVIEQTQQLRGFRLTILGRSYANCASRDIDAETRADYLARILGTAQRFYL